MGWWLPLIEQPADVAPQRRASARAVREYVCPHCQTLYPASFSEPDYWRGCPSHRRLAQPFQGKVVPGHLPLFARAAVDPE
jgi:hypothetical protein